MKELIEALEKKGVIANLQKTVNIVGLPDTKPEEHDDFLNRAISGCLATTFEKDEELEDKFFEFAIDSAMNALVKELNIKPDPEYKLSNKEQALREVSNLIASIVKIFE